MNKMKSLLIWLIFYVKLESDNFVNAISQESKCEPLKPPKNGYFNGGFCSRTLGSACVIRCSPGYKTIGSTFRLCFLKNTSFGQQAKWSGLLTRCEKIKCKELIVRDVNLKKNCSRNTSEHGTVCQFECVRGFRNIGSANRRCVAIGVWSGVEPSCKKIKNFQEISSVSIPSTTTTITTIEKTTNTIYYEDLSQSTLKFSYSFKKVSLNTYIRKLPATFQIWTRTNYTKNIKILNYNYECFQITVLTDFNSSLILKVNKFYNYNLKRLMEKNKWTQFSFMHTDQNWQFFIDGSLQIDFYQLRINSNGNNCFNFSQYNSESMSSNEFKIEDDVESKELDFYQPMRGEITKIYLFNSVLSEEEILESSYFCERKSSRLSRGSSLAFDWSNVRMDSYLREFKKRPSTFCMGCSSPELPKYAVINYEGIKNGDIRWYKCLNNYEMVGYASSVCMVYGEWSHKAPRCKRYDIKKKRKPESIEKSNKIKVEQEKNSIFISVVDYK